MKGQPVEMTNRVLEDALYYNGDIVLTYQINYPEFSAPVYQLSLLAVNGYYRARALTFQEYVKGELYREAVEQYQFAVKHGYPTMSYEALVKYSPTYMSACIISLYEDKYTFTGGAHGNTVRSAQTWNLQKCQRIRLEQLIGCTADYRAYVQEQVRQQIEADPQWYFEDYEKLLVQTFDPDSFYCTDQGVTVFYQQYDIAPYAGGIREFLLPYSACVAHPHDTCFSDGRA